MTNFEQLGLSEELLRAVNDAGYTVPTPIQRQAIPMVLQGRDILGIAQTGTGKTAGFTLPMIDILAQGRARARMPRSLILEPTRELAAQVSESFEKYGKNHKLSMALLIGGVSFGDQEAALDRGVDVLIATPGRLIDHFERGKVLLTGVSILVVDEADRMLDMGFIPDVERICSMMPQRHQTLFFSATMPPPVKKLTDQFLDNPKVIEVARPATTAENVKQYKISVSDRAKSDTLRKVLHKGDVSNAIIFCNRKRDVKLVHDSLKRHEFSVVQLHGDMDQSSRMEMLARFKTGEAKLLVASDVAARGLDIPAVSHVINYDVPRHADDYVHRIGRTGRAGRSGESVTMVSGADQENMEAIEKLIGLHVETLVLEGHVAEPQDATEKPAKAPRARRGRKPATAKESAKESPVQPAEPAAVEKPAPVEKPVAAATQPKPKPAAANEARAEKPARPRRDRERPRDDDGDDRVFGDTEFVPAFLRVQPRKSS